MKRPPRYHSPENAARALGALLDGDAPAGHDAAPEHEHERLLRTLYTIGSRERPRARFGRWLLVAGILLGIGGFAWHPRSSAPLTFAVDGTASVDGATIGAPSNQPKDVHFSDGSTFEVEPDAHLRVEASSANGSRLSLVDGKTVVHVVHHEKSAWTLNAGPFEIHVTGTRFRAGWDAMNQRLTVELYEGSVEVVGSPLNAPIPVREGQRLEAGVSANNWLLTPLAGSGNASASASLSGGAPAVESAANGDREGNPSLASSAHAPHPTSDWDALLQRADFDGIVGEANGLGIERCFSSCPARDVRILADAARYSGRTALAERSLLALRKRGPAEATTAAFLLARLDEAQTRPTAALNWYESYLKEAPNGVYAAEALAGKMRMLLGTGDGAGARSTAEVYLTRFPNGVAAATARKILATVQNP